MRFMAYGGKFDLHNSKPLCWLSAIIMHAITFLAALETLLSSVILKIWFMIISSNSINHNSLLYTKITPYYSNFHTSISYSHFHINIIEANVYPSVRLLNTDTTRLVYFSHFHSLMSYGILL